MHRSASEHQRSGEDQAVFLLAFGVITSYSIHYTKLYEAILDRGLPYVSGPQWLAENVLQGRWVLGVAGTHGKTTTSAMLAWILEDAGMAPGFLIGGVPLAFGVWARLGGTSYNFV